MSSIVKKSSHFAPKIKKRPVRKEPLATPPTTQALPEDSHITTTENDKETNKGENVQGQSPPASQMIQTEKTSANAAGDAGSSEDTPSQTTQHTNPLFNYSISSQKSPKTSKTLLNEPVVDPVSKLPGSAVQDSGSDSENDENYKDKDIFKSPIPKEQFTRRRSSVVGHHRLSGINANRRNSSISMSGTPAFSTESDLHVRDAPVTIGVPSGKPIRKRRASSVSRAGKRTVKSSVIAVPTNADILREEQEQDPPTEPSTETAEKLVHTAKTSGDGEAEYTIGLDPRTQRMRKFRVSRDVDNKRVALAPPDLVTTISSVKQLPRRVKKEDEELYRNITVEPEQMSMADLCKPMLQIGQISEVFEVAEAAKTKILDKKVKRRQARATARELRIPFARALRQVNNEESDDDETPKKTLDFDELTPQTQVVQPSNLKLALVDGQFQVDQESTIRNRGTGLNSENRPVEQENPFENLVTAGTYSKAVHTDAWTTSEMVEFYKALSTWGTDFTFIAQLFPYRTRRQIKNKFILEEKCNPEYIELALRRKLPPDFDEFCAKSSSQSTLKTVDDFNREMAEIQKEHEAHLREITTERERAIKEDLEANRKREIEIRTGSKPMTKAERVRMIRQNEVVVGEIEDVKRARDIDAGPS